MSYVKEVNDNNFDEEVVQAQGLVLIDFWAPWCGPCRKISPLIDEIAKEFEGKIKVVKVNTDDNLETAKKYKISGLPSLVLFKEGEIKEVFAGLRTKSFIVSNIEKYI